MKISFYAPFKPLGHPHPSGDLIIATGLFKFLKEQGHRMLYPCTFRSRWIYLTPWRWPLAAREVLALLLRTKRERPDLWLTYHTYYKAPDIMGPLVCGALGLPYVIFQGIYSTKRRKRLKTRVGFYLNRTALTASRHVFTNRLLDLKNLKRLLPEERITYVPPGIFPNDFSFDKEARRELRDKWEVGDLPVVVTCAMFRPGVKVRGLARVIESCGALLSRGRKFHLVVIGDGIKRDELTGLARKLIPGRVTFTGKIPREELYRYYSAGDLFVFPGIRESLGMVFLEAQSCGLPVVAFDNGGIPEVVKKGKTAFLTPLLKAKPFEKAMDTLLGDPELRRAMGDTAKKHVREHHDLDKNYRMMEKKLRDLMDAPCPETGCG